MKGYTTRLALKKRYKRTRKWTITCSTNGNFFHIAESGHRCYYLHYEKFVSAEVNDSTCNMGQKLVTKHLLRDKLRDNVVHISRLLYAKNGRNHFNRLIETVAESIDIGKDFHER